MTPAEAFTRRFGSGPTHRVSAPGRVNLIGEHIDYAGLGVLPMAIDRGITLLLRARADGRVRLANTRAERGERTFELSASIPKEPPGDWGNYPRAAAQGMVDAGLAVSGFDGLLESDLPPAAGLSSSSALVVATALALLAASGTGELPEPLALAALLAEAEAYVGTRGGGMDQAIILAARPGSALRIDFDPLAVRAVPVPDSWTFVVADSLNPAEKSGAAGSAYNARRREVEQALGPVARRAGLSGAPATYSRLTARHPVAEVLSAAAAVGVLPPRLLRRLRHVVTEAERVRRAERCLQTDEPDEFGRLMQASHASLRDDFEVSTPALDELVALSGEGGAWGARMTGAGLGGCVVALVPSGSVETFCASLHEAFYAPRGITSFRTHVFAVVPASAASVAVL